MAGQYVPFFTIQLLHNYFSDNLCDVVKVTPDANTQLLMNNLKIKWIQSDNMVYFYILSDPIYSAYPFLYPNVTDVFRFYITVTDPTFFNYTNIQAWGQSNNDLYYFSNQAGNTFGSPVENYLSLPIDNSGTGPYIKGQLLNWSGVIFEATQYTPTTVAPTPMNNYSFNAGGITLYPVSGQGEADYIWYNRGSAQSFVSSKDVCQVAAFSYNFPLPGNTLNYTSSTIYAYNLKTNQYDLALTNPPVYQNYGSSIPNSCNVNLQSLPVGRYQVNVNGNTQNLFVDNTGQFTNGLGIVEIYASPNYLNTGTDPYRLFYNNILYNEPAVNLNYGALLNPTYTVQFANNLVYWQYIPAFAPSGSTPTLSTVSLGNIHFFGFEGGGTDFTTSDSARWGSSLLMIPLVDAIPSNISPYEFVYPQATGPPATNTYNLPLAQVERFQMLQDNSGSGSGSGVSGLVSQLLVSQNYLNVF